MPFAHEPRAFGVRRVQRSLELVLPDDARAGQHAAAATFEEQPVQLTSLNDAITKRHRAVVSDLDPASPAVRDDA